MAGILKLRDVDGNFKSIPTIKGETGKSAYTIASENGYKGTEAQFGIEQVAIAANSVRLANVEQNKQDKPIAGRTFLTPLFISRGAAFNNTTGFYELNGLRDITEAQMMIIYNESSAVYAMPSAAELYINTRMRTNYRNYRPSMGANIVSGFLAEAMFYNNTTIEVVAFDWSIYPKTTHRMFMNCRSLVSIINSGLFSIQCYAIVSNGLMFSGCVKLQNVKLSDLKMSLSISDSPDLSKESILHIINSATNTNFITLTLHATAKARLTEEDIALAVSKNITIA